MADAAPRWRLEDFEVALDRWIEHEAPDADVRVTVTAWIFTRAEDPYQGVKRAAGFDNLWFGAIPGTKLGWTTVACSYWIEETRHAVRCDNFSTLSLPL